MGTLLRKSRSIISSRADSSTWSSNEPPPPLPPKDSSTGLFHHFNSIRDRRKSRIDLSTPVESEQSAAARQQREEQLAKQHSIAQLRRRLVRKASTFNLHTRHRGSPQKDLDEYRRSEHLFPDADDEAPRPQTQHTELVRPSTASYIYSEAPKNILHRERSATTESLSSQITTIPISRHSLPALYDEKTLPEPDDHLIARAAEANKEVYHELSRAQREVFQSQHYLAANFPFYKEKHYEGLGVWGKMAAPGAEPPLPYKKLKQITVEVCASS